MLAQALDAGVAADEVYGGAYRLRALLEERGVRYESDPPDWHQPAILCWPCPVCGSDDLDLLAYRSKHGQDPPEWEPGP